MSKKKKILVVSGSRHSIPPVYNSPGVPRIIYKMTAVDTADLEFKALSKFDEELNNIHFDANKYYHAKTNFATSVLELFLAYIPYRIRKRMYGFTQVDRIVYYKQLQKKLQKLKPDIVVTFMHIELFKLLQKSYPKAKHIYFFRSTHLKQRIGLDNITYLKKKSSGFLANTKSPLQELQSFGYRQPSATIYNAVPESNRTLAQREEIRRKYRAQYKLAASDFVIGYAGRFSEEKSLLELCKVVKELKEKGLQLKIVFAGDINNEKTPDKAYYHQLKNYIKEHLKEQVVFTGWITNAELYTFYEMIDVPILLSKYSEGNSMFLIEALSYGKPAVATNIGGNKEIITPNYNGFLISNNTLEKELESTIEKLFTQKKLYATMGRNARTYVLEHHNEQKMITSFQNYLLNFKS